MWIWTPQRTRRNGKGQQGHEDKEKGVGGMETDLAGKGDHVMFAKTKDFDIAHDDHLVVLLVKDGVGNDIAEPDLVASCHPEQGLGVSLWRLGETTPAGIFANALEHRLDGVG